MMTKEKEARKKLYEDNEDDDDNKQHIQKKLIFLSFT